VTIDPEKNEQNEINIATDNSKVAALVVPTNEELVIARQTRRCVENLRQNP